MKIKTILLAVFAILTFILSGYTIYDKILKTENEAISIADAVNYTDGYYNIFNVKLPKIVGKNSKNISKLNDTILNEVLPSTYGHVACHTILDNECMNEGSTVDYRYIIKNNVVAIYVYSSAPNGAKAVPATGDGLFKYNYFYDIKNDKILTFDEAAIKMGITLNYDRDIENACHYMTINKDMETVEVINFGC